MKKIPAKNPRTIGTRKIDTHEMQLFFRKTILENKYQQNLVPLRDRLQIIA